MGELDLPNGYSKIVHGIAEALAKTNLPGECSRVLWVIFRKTYGFDKKADRIALSQFVEATGMTKSHCHRALKRLAEWRIITISDGLIQFNKYSETWTLPVRTVARLGNAPYPNQGIPQLGNAVPQLGQTVPQSGNESYPNQGTTIENRNITIESSSAVPQLGYTPGQDRKVYDQLHFSDWNHVVKGPNGFGWIRGLLKEFGAEKVETTIRSIIEFYADKGFPPPNQLNARTKIREWCKREPIQSKLSAKMEAIKNWRPEE